MSKETDMLKYFDDGTLIMGKCGQVFCTVNRKSLTEPKQQLNTPINISKRNGQGYFVFSFRCKKVLCHRMQMVLTTRVPIPDNFEVMHLDEEKTNNYSYNLKIGTGKENCNGPLHLLRLGAALTGKVPSKSSREKMSAAQKGRKRTAETRRKLSLARQGEKHPLFGKHPSEETLQKLRASHKGPLNSMYGKHHTAEARQKVSEKNKGRALSKEHIDKLREGHAKYVLRLQEAKLKRDN